MRIAGTANGSRSRVVEPHATASAQQRRNRKLNRALYITARTQAHAEHCGREYIRRKQQEGTSRREAMRCLRHRISDAV